MTKAEDTIISCFSTDKKTPSIREINKEGMERFKLVGLPKRKDELYTYLNLNSIDYSFSMGGKNAKAPLVDGEVYKECFDNALVFVDGVFDPSLSRISLDGLSISDIEDEEALGQREAMEHVKRAIGAEEESFALLNAIFVGSVAVIRVSKSLERPVQIIHVLRETSGVNGNLSIVCPRILFILEEGSKAVFYHKSIGNRQNSLFTFVEDFVVKEGAELKLKTFQKKELSYYFGKRTLYLKSRSKALLTSALVGSRLTRSHFDVYMEGEGAHFDIEGIAILKDKEQSHNYVKVHHKTGESSSNQVFKSIVKDEGKASVDTTVVVHRGANGTSSSQLMQSLILSDNAEIAGKPNLMIYADDVKCNHGSTIGNVDEASIFYLRTRGIGEKEARKLLLLGFVKSVISSMSLRELELELEDVLLGKLED